ncbi:neural cell adhesion molecule L1-like isoform X2 [Brienomyrus brachyistius]|uniref:neural cell adhesion molecule L1-like isoform X2 n=1 Tax=Brienomyrus brachyistius TaxID=42636 RepID=UPI0020B2A326|nr:neural cell adhesion molecule L1-like isoform X2 [Brienomyrus brachyistius]
MSSSQIQRLGGPLSLVPFSLLLILILHPGWAVIHIPEDYQISNFKQPPVIKEQPMSYTAFTVEDIGFTCEASGNPPPIFRWLKDGQQFDPAADPRLSVSENSGNFTASGEGPISQYQGRYRCYASNELGTAVSTEARVITESTPILTKEKKVQIKVEQGDKVILYCNPPFSTTMPHIHWMDINLKHIELNERVVKGQDGSLYFSNVLSTDSRNDYICHAQYIFARTILPKEPVTLIVAPSNSVVHNRRPQLLQPPGSHSSLIALRGHSLVLECIPEGLPTPSITWHRKDGVLSQSRVIKQNFDRWLNFTSVEESDDGEYQCSAKNTQGVATHTYTVTVEAAPYWTKQPVSQLYAPGETVRLDCQADGIPTPTISWSLNGNPIAAVDPDVRRMVHGGTLTLRDVTNSDTAVYQCEASNKHGTILVNTYIYVIELAPQILTEDKMIYTATQGQTVSLICRTFGSPRPKVEWESDSHEMLLSHARVSQQVNGTLQIHDVSPQDEGLYKCSMLNTNLSISAELEVLNRTEIVRSPGHLRVHRGHSAVLHCEAYVDPLLRSLRHPQTVWRKNKHKIHESAAEDKYIFDGSSLIISNTEPKDEGVYTCEVITELDTANASGSITVVDRPDQPSHLKLSDIQNHSLTLSWTPGYDHNGPINEFVVEVESPSGGHWHKMINVSGEIEQVEIHLRPFWTYRFRVIAVNEYGRSEPSEPSELHHTPPAVPDRNPQNVRSDSNDPDSMVIAWKELDKKYFNGPGFQYKVMWRHPVGHGPHWHQNFSTTSPYVVKSTGTFKPFEIKVQAVNHIGEGPAPNAIIGYSGEDVPLEAPLNISTEDINSTTIRVTWDPVSTDSIRGHLQGYKIHLRRPGHQGGRGHRTRGNHEKHENEAWVVIVVGQGHEHVLAGLLPFSDYQLKLLVFNNKSDGPLSELHHFKTPEGVPSPPGSLHFDSPSETELTLRWTPPRHPNGILTGYLLHYQELDSNEQEMKLQIIDDPTVSHITLQNLDPKSYYSFYLRAHTSAGDGDPIVKKAATLLDSGPPTNITTFTGETSVNLSWVPGERSRNVVFLVEYYKNGEGQLQASEAINSTQSFYQLQGLKSGTYYKLKFISNNSTFWNTTVKTAGPGLIPVDDNFATQGWFIGLISAIVLLVLVLLILCFIKRSKGGKYAVKDKEEGHVDSDARPMKDETLGEYSDNDEKHSGSQPSLGGESKLGSDDSLAGCGESMEIQFNEDGSFIGQYGGVRDAPGTVGHDSSGATSPVNPGIVPPPRPSVPTSISALLRGN